MTIGNIECSFWRLYRDEFFVKLFYAASNSILYCSVEIFEMKFSTNYFFSQVSQFLTISSDRRGWHTPVGSHLQAYFFIRNFYGSHFIIMILHLGNWLDLEPGKMNYNRYLFV